MLLLYLLIALPLLKEPEALPGLPLNSSPASSVTAQATKPDTHGVETTDVITVDSQPRDSGPRLIEISGRIIDTLGQPIEDVLVTEERYFSSAHSDAMGNYRMLLELPHHRLPVLNFLRAGYNGKRVKLEQAELQQQPIHRLDMILADSIDTIRLSGWIGNDIGASLEGARVDISSLDSSEDGGYYLTVFSDQQGNFVLEGVRAQKRYRLTINLAPEYAIYQDPDYYVGAEHDYISIRLKSLEFVNLNGMILNPETAPVGNLEIYIKNVTTGVHTRKIVSDSSGFFSLEEFPLGEVSLTTRGADFFKISGLKLSKSDYSNLVLIVDKGDRHLTGWVSDEDGIAIEKAMVTLDATINDGAIEYFSYRSSSTDNTGKFSFDGIASGDHRISIYANGFNKLDLPHSFRDQSDQLHLVLTRHY